MAQPRHPNRHPRTGKFTPSRGGTDDLGDAAPRLPNQSGTAQPPNPGSATPGATFPPASGGSRGGGSVSRPIRPAAPAGTDQSGGPRA